MSHILTELAREGYHVTREEVALLSPYQTQHIKRFGNYIIDWESLPHLVEEEIPLLE